MENSRFPENESHPGLERKWCPLPQGYALYGEHLSGENTTDVTEKHQQYQDELPLCCGGDQYDHLAV